MINYAHLKSQMIQLLDLLRSILYPNVFDAMEEAHSKEELETAARRQLREILERIYREPPQYDDVIDILFSKHKAIHTKRLYLQALRLAFFHFSAPVVPAFYRSIPVFFHDTVAIR